MRSGSCFRYTGGGFGVDCAAVYEETLVVGRFEFGSLLVGFEHFPKDALDVVGLWKDSKDGFLRGQLVDRSPFGMILNV